MNNEEVFLERQWLVSCMFSCLAFACHPELAKGAKDGSAEPVLSCAEGLNMRMGCSVYAIPPLRGAYEKRPYPNLKYFTVLASLPPTLKKRCLKDGYCHQLNHKGSVLLFEMSSSNIF